MDFPKISVIVPVYKVEKYLPECIESILSQTYTNFELLLIDDGSPDNSGQICDEYATRDSRIRVFHKENGGVSSARNLGIDNAKGKWIAFIDSDDTIEPNYLSNFGHNDSNYVQLYAQGYRIIGIDSKIHYRRLPNQSNTTKEDAFKYLEESDINNSPVFKLYSLSIIKQHSLRFDENTSYGEDHLFTLEYFKHVDKVFLSSECGYNYIRREISLTNRSIPINELCHYYIESDKIFKRIFNSPQKVTYIFNKRKYSTIKRIFKEINLQDIPVNKIKSIKSIIKSSYTSVGLTLKQRLFCKVLLSFPSSITKYILNSIIFLSK